MSVDIEKKYGKEWGAKAAGGLSADWIIKNVNPSTGKTYSEETRLAQAASPKQTQLQSQSLTRSQQIWEKAAQEQEKDNPDVAAHIRKRHGISVPKTEEEPKSFLDSGDQVVSTSDPISDRKNRDDELNQKAKDVEDLYLERFFSDQDTEIESLTTEQKLRKAREDLGLDPNTGDELTTPALPQFESTYEALRSDAGLLALESHLNQLDKDIADMEASLTKGLRDKEGRLASAKIVSTEQRELTRQVQESLDTLTRERNSLVNEINTKNTIISTTMNLKQMDYEAAKDDYTTKFNTNLKLLDLLEDREDRAESAAEQIVDNAKANLNSITSLVKEANLSWDDLDVNTQNEIAKLETTSGLPSGIVQAFMKATPNAEILYTTKGSDAMGNDFISFIYKGEDGMPGITKTVYTGGKSKPVSDDDDVNEFMDDDGNVFDLTTEEGLKDAQKAGMKYEDAYNFLDKKTKWSATVIKDKLERAGFRKAGDEIVVDDAQLPSIADKLVAQMEVVDALKLVNTGELPSGGKVYVLKDSQIKKLKDLIYNQSKTE